MAGRRSRVLLPLALSLVLPFVQAPAAAQAKAQKSDLELQADRCLDWYRPLLRDPRGAYTSGSASEKGVLSLTIHATNAHGGYVPLPAACEFRNGVLDEGWTQIHAKRHGWK
jgi:hypothetical protein